MERVKGDWVDERQHPKKNLHSYVFSKEPSTNSEKFNINPSLSPPSFYQSKARLYQSIWRIPEVFFSHVAAVLNLRSPEIDS
ncbi:hypothetical protein L1887_03712 [Cichorium endivia]|nr:hypothetical protein L1887_03712 [Cichorium endivia]